VEPFFFPKGTPEPIVRRLNEATIAALDTPAVQKRLSEVGAFVARPEQRSPDYLQTFVLREIDRWAAVIKAAGIIVE
jgi:tripartite-type tricarboxylate transporter receptor subunit TctC